MLLRINMIFYSEIRLECFGAWGFLKSHVETHIVDISISSEE